MQLIANKRLATARRRENRFPLDAFWEMGIYSRSKTAGFVAWAEIQFSHRWVNWESIRECRVCANPSQANQNGVTRFRQRRMAM
ncbi:hypothetical protein Pan181_00330 [Aeoliella mucimassa]|uniref:Uncharacterized protein n=1 Tax=Aeoliella mucimassa TaxID=2527972 RepID=A0A518AGJ8_9BACT|nr:hypothetical protein Pan181_00330 [Aeoliella mucimassa]